MQPVSRDQLERNRLLRASSFGYDPEQTGTYKIAKGDRTTRTPSGRMAPHHEAAGASRSTHDGSGNHDAGADASSKETGAKKNKRKSKKSSGVKGGNPSEASDDQLPPPPTSYAEAIKEDPEVAEQREVAEAKTEDHIPPPPTTYAEAVQEEPAMVEKREAIEAEKEDAQQKASNGSDTGSRETSSKPNAPAFPKPKETSSASGASSTKTTSQRDDPSKESIDDEKPITPVFSQASTALEYPELQSDPEDEEEEQERRRDREKSARIARVRWAPIDVPFKRRLQTLAVLFHSLCMGVCLSAFFTLCAIPFTWPLIIIYLIAILFATDAVDGKLRRRREWARRLPIWRYFADYFPAKLHKTHDLVPTRKYIFGYHPHGIISHGAWTAFATDALGFSEKFPGITNSLLTLDSNFRLPFYREYVFAMGVLSVSRESIKNILSKGGPNNEGMGRAVTIVIGGARESLEAQPHTMRLVIKERKGFVKLAVQTGADLVPVVAFGENELYDQLDPHEHPWLHGLQRYFLKAWKFTVPLLHGRGIFNYDVGLMPYRRPLNIVVGKPIQVMQASNPDNSEVDRLHDLYTEELQKIYDRYKDEFAPHRKEDLQFLD